MTSNDVIWSIIGCAVILGVAYWYVRRRWVRQLLAHDAKIAAEFSNLLERQRWPLLYDINQLPFPKDQIRIALFRLLTVEQDKRAYAALATGLFALSNYQSGVGNKPVDPSAIYGITTPRTLEEWDRRTSQLKWSRFEEVSSDPHVRELLVRQLSELQNTTEFLKRAEMIGVKRAFKEVSARWRQILAKARDPR